MKCILNLHPEGKLVCACERRGLGRMAKPCKEPKQLLMRIQWEAEAFNAPLHTFIDLKALKSTNIREQWCASSCEQNK
jgi:hypothetical protein